MPLQLKIVSQHSDLLGDDFCRDFGDEGGTIGRALQNDWILPDPDRFISGRHATIDFKGGIYYLADTSSNGVYVNDEYEPIGKGNIRRLFNGDRLRMGDFLFEVHIDAGETLVVPLADDSRNSTVDPDIDELVDEFSISTGVQLLDEEEITGDDEFQSTLFGGDDVQSEPLGDLSDIIEEMEPPPATPAEEPKETAAKSETTKSALEVTAEDLFDSLLDGLGMHRADLSPTVNRPEMMMAAGLVLRELTGGLSELLAARNRMKQSLSMSQTTLLPQSNNPLKFSENTTDLLKQLLTGEAGDYLGAQDAIREANRDLINHQNAMFDAMAAAFADYVERFDPNELELGFDSRFGEGMLSFVDKIRYWEQYRDAYPAIAARGDGPFPQMFAEEFINAYERHTAEYRRRDREGTDAAAAESRDEPPLAITQEMDPPLEPADAEPQTAEPTSIVVSDNAEDSGALEIDYSFIRDLEEESVVEEAPKSRFKKA